MALIRVEDSAKGVEFFLHGLFGRKRIRGEYYALSLDEVKWLQRLQAVSFRRDVTAFAERHLRWERPSVSVADLMATRPPHQQW